jgi:dephospho-CoA kinase
VAAALAIAVTGGIASGKSEVTRRFESHGVVVLDADRIARELVEPGAPALAEITTRFGPALIDAQGQLDRRRLREIVFADAAARRDLEAILHPRVRETLRQRAAATTGAYVLLAIPLLIETERTAAAASGIPAAGGTAPYAWVDRILVVDVPTPVQIARVMRRDAIDQAAAHALLAAQATRADRLARAHDVIVNDGDLAHLDAAVQRLHARYLRRAERAMSAAV